MVHSDTQYRAFISYSHADMEVVDWLHPALEAYGIPSKLVGQQTPFGPVPAHLAPIFRDRGELPAAGDLSAELKAALRRSRFLVVVCSPAAAQSKWVNEEVRQFKQMHGHKRGDDTARVVALIVAGDPADPGEGNCFPPALRYHVRSDGTISDDPAEPVAADVRPGGDGRKLAKLKLVAGLAGLPLDALVQREAARRQRQAAAVAGASLVLVAVMAVLTVLAIQGRGEAERQRAQADGLIEYMLTDLRRKLEPVGRLEVLDSVGQRALAYYSAQALDALDPDELGRRARALHLVGEVRDLRGDSDGALKAFQEAERTTAEQLERDPDNPDRMFDHAQSVFWVGQTAWARRDWPTTEEKFRTYVALADQMAATNPGNAKWQLEQGYAANSLGAFFLEAGRPAEAIPQFQRYLAVSAKLAKAKPGDRTLQKGLGQAHAWLADAQATTGQIAQAREARLQELAIYGELLAQDSRDSEMWAMVARAQDALGEIHILEGDLKAAVERGRIALNSFRPLLEVDPANTLVRELAVNAANRYGEALLLQGRIEEAKAANRFALDSAEQLVRSDPARASWRTALLMRARWIEVAVSFARMRPDEGRDGLSRFRADFGPDREADIAAGHGKAWVQLHALEAMERSAAGDRSAALARANEAAQAAGALPTPQETAVLAFLTGRVAGFAPPAVGPGSAYPADKLLSAVGRPGSG